MRRGEMLTVFCYDISTNRSRRKVAKLLEKEATRVQYSVFESRMTEQQHRGLAQRLVTYLKDGDSLRVYVIGANGERRTHVYGDGPPLESTEGFWIL